MGISSLFSMVSLLLLFSTLGGCKYGSPKGGKVEKDTTHTIGYISKISLMEPERALAIVDTIEMNKEESPYIINLMRFAVYHNTADYRMANYYGLQALKDSAQLAKDPTRHLTLLTALAEINNLNSQYSQCMKYAKAARDVALRNNNEPYVLASTDAMALSMIKMGNVDEGLKIYERGREDIMKLIERKIDFNTANIAYSLVGNYIESLLSHKRYKEAEAILPDLLTILEKTKTIENVLDGLVEYRQMHTYSLKMKLYDNTGRQKESEKCLEELKKSKLAESTYVQSLVAEHYNTIKDYRNLAKTVDYIRKNSVQANDTLTDFFLSYVLQMEQQCYREKGDYRKALEKGDAIVMVMDSLAKRDKAQQVMQLAKIYETQEKDRLIAEKEKQLNRQVFFIATAVVVIVVAILVILLMIRYNRQLGRRNKAIVATINNMMEKEDQLVMMRMADADSNGKIDPNELRMFNAIKMLKETEDIARVAKDCGFANEEDFVGRFRNQFGISPYSYVKWSAQLHSGKTEDTEHLKDSFIKNMTHEIRTPLNQIYGFVQILTDPNIVLTDEDRRTYNNIIAQQTNNMTSMLNKFIEISEYESSDEPLPKSTVDVNSLFDSIRALESKLNAGVTITYENSNSTDTIETNQKGLTRILQCLAGNAMKFTQSGSISIRCLTNGNGNTVFTVTDTGKGIPEGEEEKIFDRFYKVDEFVPGTGLGLSLCRIIAKRIGATIALDRSYNEKGARFIVTL